MNWLNRSVSALVGALAFVAMSAATAGAQTGRNVGEPVPVPAGTSESPLVPLLVVAGAIIVVTAILAFRRVGAAPRPEPVKDATEDELRAAKADMLSSRTKDALCAEAAHQAVVLAHADGAAVILDDFDGRAGTPIEVHENLVTRVRREKTLVKLKRVRALPVITDGEVVGLVAAIGGDTETLSAISRFVSEAYTSRHQSSTSRLDAAVAKAADADVDGLTGVGNRRRFDEDLAAVAGQGEKMPVSLAMFDIDNFQFYNDAHGKQAGNEVLKSIAELIAGNLRGSDVMYRYSGVKFVALLPGADVDNAEVVVERIRAAVESTRFDGEEVQPLGRVTLSVGVAEAPSDNTATLIDAAGQALERAKASGRNTVVIEGDIS